MASDKALSIRVPLWLHAELVRLAEAETRSLNHQVVHLLKKEVAEPLDHAGSTDADGVQ
jgi:hypothetical protein